MDEMSANKTGQVKYYATSHDEINYSFLNELLYLKVQKNCYKVLFLTYLGDSY